MINPTNGDPTPELELYPISLRLFRHSPPPTRGGITTWTGVGFGLSSFGFGTNSLATPHAPPKRYLAYVASFSRMNTIQQVRQMFTDVSLSEVKFYWCTDHWSKSLTDAIIYYGKCSVDHYGKNNFLLGNKCIINLLTHSLLEICDLSRENVL